MNEVKRSTSVKAKFQKIIGTKAPETKPVAAKNIAIDYPQANEAIRAGHYAIRLSGPTNSKVEVSINGSAWQVCREAHGFFWFDWYPKNSGEFKLAARISGQATTVAERALRVVNPGTK